MLCKLKEEFEARNVNVVALGIDTGIQLVSLLFPDAPLIYNISQYRTIGGGFGT